MTKSQSDGDDHSDLNRVLQLFQKTAEGKAGKGDAQVAPNPVEPTSTG